MIDPNMSLNGAVRAFLDEYDSATATSNPVPDRGQWSSAHSVLNASGAKYPPEKTVDRDQLHAFDALAGEK